VPARRSAADALNTDAARAFLEQGRAEPATPTPREPGKPSPRMSKAIDDILHILGEDEPQAEPAAGRVSVTFRLDPLLVRRLRVAAANRSVSGVEPRSQQAIVAAALTAWLDEHAAG